MINDIQLNDGNTIPQFGLGVWQVSDQEVVPAVAAALEAGYTHVDTAQGYGNERGVGEAIRQSGISREQLFITTKLRNGQQGFETTLRAFDESMKKLGLDVLDLFLIHWPMPEADRYLDTWKAFVRLQQEKRIRSIGVSNFLPEHLDRIIGETGVTPAVNQIELHPRYQQQAVRDYHREHNIAIESYSPLGSGAVLGDDTIAAIAQKHGKSPAQVMIRWHLQQDLIVIPKSSKPERIRENIDVFDFELDSDDLEKIRGLDRPKDGKVGANPLTMHVAF